MGPPSPPLRSRAIWDASRCVDASFSDRIKPYLYELGLLDLTFANIHAASQNLLTRATTELSALRRLFRKHKSGLHDMLDLFIEHYVTILLVVVFLAALFYVETNYGGGQLLISVTCLALIFHYGFEEGGGGRSSAYSVFNGFMSILGSVDAHALAAQYAGGGLAGAAAGNVAAGDEGSDGEGEGEGEEALRIEDDGDGVAEGGAANLPVRRQKTKKKTKGRREEIEARRERQFQMQAAREEEFRQAMMMGGAF